MRQYKKQGSGVHTVDNMVAALNFPSDGNPSTAAENFCGRWTKRTSYRREQRTPRLDESEVTPPFEWKYGSPHNFLKLPPHRPYITQSNQNSTPPPNEKTERNPQYAPLPKIFTPT